MIFDANETRTKATSFDEETFLKTNKFGLNWDSIESIWIQATKVKPFETSIRLSILYFSFGNGIDATGDLNDDETIELRDNKTFSKCFGSPLPEIGLSNERYRETTSGDEIKKAILLNNSKIKSIVFLSSFGRMIMNANIQEEDDQVH